MSPKRRRNADTLSSRNASTSPSDEERSNSSNESDAINETDGKLCHDLSAVFTPDFVFEGGFYHRSVDTEAPDPGLTIKGVGLVKLPLSERGAKQIMSRLAQAPGHQGRRAQTKATTCKVEPADISFTNSNWKTYIDCVLAKVLTSLGVAEHKTRPDCELASLTVHEGNSSNLGISQATSKGGNVFATITLVLPSTFQGGEVHLSHAGRTATLDVSQESSGYTSAIGWYSGLKYEVKPITSGYRLALCYNVAHTVSNAPKPSPPAGQEQKLHEFGNILKRWRDRQYSSSSIPKPPILFTPLANKYSDNDLCRGMDALQPRDAHLISNLLPIAEEMDIALCVANWERTLPEGESDSDSSSFGRYDKRMRYESYKCSFDFVDSEDNSEDNEMEVSKVVRVGINETVDLRLDTFQLEKEALVRPEDVFGELPCERRQRYPDEELGHSFSALGMFPKKDEVSMIISINGHDALLRSIPLTDTPTPADEEVVEEILAKPLQSVTASKLLQYALSWKRYDIWNRVITFVDVKAITSAIKDGLEVFKLSSIKPGLSEFIRQQSEVSGLQGRLDATTVVAACFKDGNKAKWIQDLVKDALVSYDVAEPDDVPTLLRLAQELTGGIKILQSKVILKTKAKPDTYDFHISLAENVRKQCLKGPKAKREGLSNLLQQSLLAAATHWTTSPRWDHDDRETLLVERITKIIHLCFSLDNPELCIETIFKETPTDHQMDVVFAIKRQIGATTPDWVKTLMKTALSLDSIPLVSHVPTLSWITEELGPQELHRFITVTCTPQSDTYSFLIALAESLHKQLPKDNRASGNSTQSTLYDVIITCVRLAIPQWEAGLDNWDLYQGDAAGPAKAKVERIVNFVELCFMIGNMEPCATLFSTLITSGDLSVARFKELHFRLMAPLRATLVKHKRSVTDQPFQGFFVNCISFYLGSILSTTPPHHLSLLLHPSKVIGCGHCGECNNLSRWIRSLDARPIEFTAVQSTRTHVEKYIEHSIGHLVTSETRKGSSPHTLVVSKLPDIVLGIRWEVARSAAVEFLGSICDVDKELPVLMGARIDDVRRAITGMGTFRTGPFAVIAADPPIRTGSSGSVPANVPRVAGKKRKRGAEK